MVYCDYTASGRCLVFVERYLQSLQRVYANTHTESSGTGLQTSRFREDARSLIRAAVGGDDQTAVIFTGAGSTAAINKLVGILGLVFETVLGANPPMLDRDYKERNGLA